MSKFLSPLATLAFIGAVAIFWRSQNPLYETEGFVMLLTAAVLFSGACVVQAIADKP